MRLYLDACCLNRLTDDQSQPRVRKEAEAIERILGLVRKGSATWVSSVVLEVEISRNPDVDRRRDVEALLRFADEEVVPGPKEKARAGALQRLGYGAFDALHLACAEQRAVDVFLTTDDGLLRRARRRPGTLRIRVGESGILVGGGYPVIPVGQMSDEEFESHALGILRRELGVDGLARFLRVYRSGSGNYTRDRHRWLEGATIEDIMADVERRRPSASQ